MNDIAKGIGEKIKEQRLKRGLTQKELAGDKITRNMLSLIESGSAAPSIPTLVYISERLETPIAYFLSTSDNDVAVFRKMSVIYDLKKNFKHGNYRECINISSSLPENAIDDEVAYITAFSHIRLSVEMANSLDIRSAVSELDKALCYTEKSIYCGCKLKESLEYLRELYSSICSDSISDILCDFYYCSEFVPTEHVMYFSALKAVSSGDSSVQAFPVGSYFERHLLALRMIQEERIPEAQKRLRELSLDPETPYFMQYRILCDLENAANISGDYRLAYSSSRRRVEFIKRNKI